MTTEFQGRESKLNQRGAGVQSVIRQDQYANLLVSQSLPKYTDLALNNKLFAAATGNGTFIAPAIAPLTTNAGHLLYNSSANKILIILRVWANLESGTRAIGSSLWGAVTTTAEASAPAKATSSTIGGIGHNASSVAVYDNAVTLDAAPVWFLLAARDTLADANESSGILTADLDGMVIVPPTLCFAVAVRDSAAGTTPLYNVGFIWAELTLDQA